MLNQVFGHKMIALSDHNLKLNKIMIKLNGIKI